MASVPPVPDPAYGTFPPGGPPPKDDEPIGGLLALESADELALGAAEDYGVDVVAMGEDDGDGPVFGLSFATPGDAGDGTGAWELSALAELVVQETRGEFEASGDARHDASVMEDEFDPDDEVVVAVWAPTLPGAPPRVRARVRRKAVPIVRREYLPYGVIAGGLAVLLGIVVVGVFAIALFGLLAGGSSTPEPIREARPVPPSIDPAPREPAEPQTADEILEEVLGEEPAKER